MTTHDLYSFPASDAWPVAMTGQARFSWEYDDGRERLLNLYRKGKDKQWDADKRIDWSLDVDPDNPLDFPDETVPIFGSAQWDKLDRKAKDEVRRHMASWQFSQFLHGEQGAMICSARIVESVPDLDAKFYAATQTVDEARHAELYARFLTEKVGLLYPINTSLQSLLGQTLSDSRWDMPYLGMQVLIEGLALAAFGLLRDLTPAVLPKQILAYVMQDEARHVAFGRIALRDYYQELTEAERDEREEFVVEGCYLMRDRFRAEEVWETLGFDVRECNAHVETAPYMLMFRSLLFSRIVPCMRDIGLFGPRVRQAFADLGVLDMAGADLEALMKGDEDLAESLDSKRRNQDEAAQELGRSHVDAIVAAGTE
jgi:hypothetical protein